MVQLTRLDCAITSAAYMRAGLAHAIHHARHRSVFQRKLVDQPLMRTVLADLALEREGATALSLRLAAAFGRAADADEAAFARIVTPAAKLWVCKSAPGYVYEAMECLGGNGYVEELPLARLYREVPLNAIWEGSGNVMALDLLRGAERDKEGMERMLAGLANSTADLPGAPAALDRVKAGFAARDREVQARRTAETLAHLAAAAALKASAPPAVAEAFAGQRFNGAGGRLYGNPMAGSVVTTVLERSLADA
jgi:putative acyl-CoA dehydrogenase